MSFRSDLRTRLTGDTTIATLVSDRVYSVTRPYGATADSIIVMRSSSEPQHDLNNGAGFESGRFLIICLSETLTSADSIAEAVRQRIQGESGTWGSSKIFSVIFEDEADDYFPLNEGKETGLYAVSLTYRIQRELSVPS